MPGKTMLWIFVLFCFFYPAILFPQGTVVNDSLFSNSLGYYKKVNVYLPQGYNPSGSTRYRVIYLLHGAQGNQNYFSSAYGIFDSLITNNIIQPVIIVIPDASVGPYAGSFYTNSLLYGLFEDYIYIDVIGYVDGHYKTLASRSSRCIMGHSMGGYGCMKIALKHSSLFRGVASHSGPLDFYHFTDARLYILLESGIFPPYAYNPANGSFSLLGFSLAGAFSPNLNSLPYHVDFPLNTSGVIVDSVFARWKPHNPARLSSNINASTNLAMYFDCGLQDELTLLNWNNSFRDTLLTRNIPFVYKTFTGGHSNALNGRIPISLKFLDSAMNIPLSVKNENNETPFSYGLLQNYPNPFNPNTVISFRLPVAGQVSLKVYDELGRETETLVNEQLRPGTYEVSFNGSKLSSGVYFYKLTAGDFIQTRAMIFNK